MKHLNQAATKVLLSLVKELPVGGARKIDNAKGAFMAVSIDALAEHGRSRLVSVAHNFIQNGDVCPDPDVEFLIVDQGELGTFVYPTAIQQVIGPYRRAVNFGENLAIESYRKASQADITSFCNVWMKNIRDQQRLSDKDQARRAQNLLTAQSDT